MYKQFWYVLCEFMSLQLYRLEVCECEICTEAFSQLHLSEDPDTCTILNFDFLGCRPGLILRRERNFPPLFVFNQVTL